MARGSPPEPTRRKRSGGAIATAACGAPSYLRKFLSRAPDPGSNPWSHLKELDLEVVTIFSVAATDHLTTRANSLKTTTLKLAYIPPLAQNRRSSLGGPCFSNPHGQPYSVCNKTQTTLPCDHQHIPQFLPYVMRPSQDMLESLSVPANQTSHHHLAPCVHYR